MEQLDSSQQSAPPPALTLKELAQRARVHPSTVSRVANNDPRLRIRESTRDRIESILRETQYRPNGVARSLKLGHRFLLAVVIPDITNPFFASLYRGIEDRAAADGYTIVLSNTDGDPARQLGNLTVLAARGLDGVILASVRLGDPAVLWVKQRRLPYVLVNRFSGPADPFVGSDDVLGARLATEHLLALGHARIAHLSGGPQISTSVLRQRGYQTALAAAGHPTDPALVVEAGYSEAGGIAATERLLSLAHPPTAVFAVTDVVAIGVYQAARRHDVRIPEELAVVGYNDIPLARRMVPALTTVRVPVYDFGRTAADILLQEIADGRPSDRRVIFTPELIVRGSSQPEQEAVSSQTPERGRPPSRTEEAGEE